MDKIYRGIGRYVVGLILLGAATFPAYIILITTGTNGWIAAGVIFLGLFNARLYWFLHSRLDGKA